MVFERIKKFVSGLEHHPAPAQPQGRPDDPNNPAITLTGMVAITYRCQCKCKHCGSAFYTTKKPDELTSRELKNLMDQMPAVRTDTVSFFGGEPLLRDDICELIAYGKKLGLGTVLDTNGAALDEAMAKRLKDAGLDMAFISIDSSNPEVHDNLRGIPGLFDRAVAAISLCKKYGIHPRIATYVDRERLHNGDFARLIEFSEKLGAELRILLPILAGRWSAAKDVKLTPEEIQKFKGMLKPGKVYWEQEVCSSHNSNFVCAALSRKMYYVTAYGDLTPCCYVPLSFGNVKKEPLKTILDRMYKHPVYKNPNCNDCIMNDPGFRDRYLEGFKTATTYPLIVDYSTEIPGPPCGG